jgi:hypothetical protein
LPSALEEISVPLMETYWASIGPNGVTEFELALQALQ